MIMFHRFTSIRKREDVWNGNSYYRQSEAESPDPAAGRMAIRIWEVNLKKIITELSEALLSAVCRIRRRCSHWTRAILYGQGWHTLWKYLRLPGRWDRILRKIFCYIKRMRASNRTWRKISVIFCSVPDWSMTLVIHRLDIFEKMRSGSGSEIIFIHWNIMVNRWMSSWPRRCGKICIILREMHRRFAW